MKKILAIVMTLAMVFTAATVLAEENAFSYRNGVTFGMNMDQVMATETGPYEIESEHTRGAVRFDELEYEHTTVDGKPADLTYHFVGNGRNTVKPPRWTWPSWGTASMPRMMTDGLKEERKRSSSET